MNNGITIFQHLRCASLSNSSFISSVLSLCLAVLALGAFAHADEGDGIVPWKKSRSIPAFSLQDQDGKSFTRSNIEGGWSMVFIGFTSCPDVCPYTLANLESIRANLGLRVMPDSLPQIVFLAVDPERDKSALKSYLGHFHGEFIGVTGEKVEIDKFADGLDAFYRIDKKSGKPNYDVVHSAKILIVNPKAEVVAHMVPPFRPQATALTLFKIIKGIDVHG